MVRFLLTASMLALTACAPKLTDKPDATVIFDKPWVAVADCVYGQFINAYKHPPSQVSYTKVETQQQALIGVTTGGGEGLLTVKIEGTGDTSARGTSWAQSTPFGGDIFKDQAWNAMATCGGHLG
jgi:hypothetical protein